MIGWLNKVFSSGYGPLEEGELIRAIKGELYKLPTDVWPRVYCDLNCWEWPKDLPQTIKPTWFKSKGKMMFHRQFHLVRPILEEIKDRVGEKAVSRYWNRERMNDQEFELWWTKNLNGEL
jgi:hypothetical protein